MPSDTHRPKTDSRGVAAPFQTSRPAGAAPWYASSEAPRTGGASQGQSSFGTGMLETYRTVNESRWQEAVLGWLFQDVDLGVLARKLRRLGTRPRPASSPTQPVPAYYSVTGESES